MKRFYSTFRTVSLSIALMLMALCASAQNLTVTGVVSDQNGPLAGVAVIEKGTTNGAISNEKGSYSITVKSPNAQLEYSYLGYNSQTLPINNNSVIDVTLKEDALNVEEVVVTALGIKRSEKALGYSVQKIDGETLQKVSGANVATSLTGKVAGLLVKNSSDFAATPDIQIRGEAPLIVIDGVPYTNKTLNDIPSEDIASISLLKGATASALYGYRGSSGAMLVTTKTGSGKDGGLSVSLSTNTMFSAGFLAIPEKQAMYGRGSNNTYDVNSTSAWGTLMDGRILNQWDPFAKEYRDYTYLPSGKNNFKNFLEGGFVTNNNISVGYSQEGASIRSSFNWIENKGQYPNQMQDKFTYTLGGDIQFKRLTLSSNLAYSKMHSPNIGSNGYTSYDPMYSLLIWSAADFDIRDYKDNYWLVPGQSQNYTYQGVSQMNNPYFDAYEKTNEAFRDVFNADLTVSYDIATWLKATLRSGMDYSMDRNDLRVAMGSYLQTGNTPVPGNQWTWNGYMTGAYVTGRTQGFSLNNDFILNGEKEVGEFNFEYLAGGTIFYTNNNTIYAATDGGLSVPGFYSLNASVNPAKVDQTTRARQVNSLYGRIGVSWRKMLFVEATGRNDWSSTMPSDGRSYFYPSVAGSFVISELLPQTSHWLDMLKVRGSWTVSKTPPGIYDITQQFDINAGTWNTNNGAVAPGMIYPNTLLPASSSTFEVGLQGFLFKNRLMADVTYYQKRMYDFLLDASLTPASGYNTAKVNSKEEITRKGWEIQLTGSPIRMKDWSWDIGVNWSKYARHYTKLDPEYSDVQPWIKKGKRVDAYVSRDYLRDPQGNMIYNNSGNVQFSQYDSVFGYSDPDWIWGVNTTLRWKNLSLFIAMDGVVGGMMTTRTESYMWEAGIHPSSLTSERALDVATPGSRNMIGKGVKVVSGTATYDKFGNITSDNRVFAPNDIPTTYKEYAVAMHGGSAWGGNGTRADAYAKTFFKLRELSLTYTLPSKALQATKFIKGAQISFVGQNLLLWAKDFKFSDPDGGVEDFADPAVRYLGVNIKLNF